MTETVEFAPWHVACRNPDCTELDVPKHPMWPGPPVDNVTCGECGQPCELVHDDQETKPAPLPEEIQ